MTDVLVLKLKALKFPLCVTIFSNVHGLPPSVWFYAQHKQSTNTRFSEETLSVK
jgi:hypothetical protein